MLNLFYKPTRGQIQILINNNNYYILKYINIVLFYFCSFMIIQHFYKSLKILFIIQIKRFIFLNNYRQLSQSALKQNVLHFQGMCPSTLLSNYFLYFSLLFIYVFFRIFRSRCVGAFHRLIEVISNCKLIALVSVPTERPKTERLKSGRTAWTGLLGTPDAAYG